MTDVLVCMVAGLSVQDEIGVCSFSNKRFRLGKQHIG